jgi:hypothetical protein
VILIFFKKIMQQQPAAGGEQPTPRILSTTEIQQVRNFTRIAVIFFFPWINF